MRQSIYDQPEQNKEPILDATIVSPPEPRRAKVVTSQPHTSPIAKFFSSLLDPVVLQRLLAAGGALSVLGLLITLASYGLFENKLFAASVLGSGSLAIIGGGWWLLLKTRHQTAGIALTFLGCVILPLNLWFYHAQDLIRVDQHLWVCGLVCMGIYAATLFTLRRPIFIYALQLGSMLTMILLLAQVDQWNQLNWVSTLLIIAGAATIYLPFVLPKEDTEAFPRSKYGPPLIIGGHIQLAIGLVFLGFVQMFGYQFPINQYVNDWGILWQNNIGWLSAMWLIGSAVYFSTSYLRRESAWILPGVACLLLVSFEWLHMTQVDTPWLLLAMSGVGVVLMIASPFARISNHNARELLFGIGLAILGLCHTGLTLKQLSTISQAEPLLTKIVPLFAGLGVLAIAAIVSGKKFRPVVLGIGFCELTLLLSIVGFHSTIPLARKVEFFAVGGSLLMLATGFIRQLKETDRENPENSLLLWFGSLALGTTILVFGLLSHFGSNIGHDFDQPILLIGAMVMVAFGIVSQMKSTTITGIVALTIYIGAIVVSVLQKTNVAAGIYIGVGGVTIFTIGILLTIFREKLLTLPERMSKREGVFQFLNWR